jgi:hypothetical protein
MAGICSKKMDWGSRMDLTDTFLIVLYVVLGALRVPGAAFLVVLALSSFFVFTIVHKPSGPTFFGIALGEPNLEASLTTVATMAAFHTVVFGVSWWIAVELKKRRSAG